MKKLMIAAAIVCAAAMSQAASVLWGGAIADPSYYGVDDPAYAQKLPSTAYLLWAESDLGASTSFDLDTGLSDTGFKQVDQYSITASDAQSNWVFGKEYVNAGKDVNGYYQVLVTNDKGDLASIYSFSVSGTGPTSHPVDKKLNQSWSTGAFLEQNGYTVSVVPEPTSGLLLLLGVAGLALKRRRA